MIGIAVISVHGLNILTGYCGQISIGHVGLYGSRRLYLGYFDRQAWLAILGGPALCCPGCGNSRFDLRPAILKDQGLLPHYGDHRRPFYHYLDHHSSSAASPVVPDGLTVPKPQIGSIVLSSKASYFYLVMVIACLATLLAKNIVRTRAGRAFVAIRDNDLAAEVMGISLWSYKLQAFFIGCVYAGVAGALLVHYYAFASVDQFPFHGFGLVSGYAHRRGYGQHPRGYLWRRISQAAG